MKLIDILNLIAKGELEEGTKIKWGDDVYEDVESLWDDMYFDSLNEEVEIIGKDTKAHAKIEEITDSVEFLNYSKYNENWILSCVKANRDKLNEVIRELNRRGE